MNNGTHCYTQASFISLQYSYYMEKSPEVTKKKAKKKSNAFNNFLKVITTVINMKNHF